MLNHYRDTSHDPMTCQILKFSQTHENELFIKFVIESLNLTDLDDKLEFDWLLTY